MKLQTILITIACGTAHASSQSVVTDTQSSSSSDEKTIVRIEKKDLLQRVMKSLPAEMDTPSRNKIFSVATTILQESFETPQRNIISAGTKNTYGYNFPLDPEVLRDVIDLSQGKRVLEIAAANGENAFLIGLSGAKNVVINDIEPSEIEKCRKRLASFPPVTQSTFTLVPGDCLQVFESEEYTESFDLIYARNVLHFLCGEKRDRFIQTVQRLLKPGGQLVITVNSAQQLIHAGKIENYTDEYVFKYRGYKLRLPGQDVNFFQTFAIEHDLNDVNPLRYRFIPLIRFAHGRVKYEEEFAALSAQDKKKLQNCADNCIDEMGSMLATGNHVIECHENQTVAYTQRALAKALIDKPFTARKTVYTDLKGHNIDSPNSANHLTMFFEKLPQE